MSASPSTPSQSVKRPLEDPSSPSGPTDQPDAKRPALDKTAESEDVADEIRMANGDATNGMKAESPSPADDSALAMEGDVSANPLQYDESAWIHIRAVISSAEAATVIGKGGENVTLIRKMSGAKCTVSDYQKGAVERILTVSGVVDAAAKVDLATSHAVEEL